MEEFEVEGVESKKTDADSVLERFLRYVSVDTQSDEASDTAPSSAKQLNLARMLKEELEEMGAQDVKLDEYGIVTARIPANLPHEDAFHEAEQKPAVLGLIAHMDTSPAVSGADVRPRIYRDYAGQIIFLGENGELQMSPADFPELLDYQGQTLITSGGDTLLGADDKAGVAEIMCCAQRLLASDDIPHPEIRIAFTPDEEIGRGTDHFDVKDFGADFAYTVDGGPWPCLEYECFNAASAFVDFIGLSTHPGSALGRMRNALLLAQEFQSHLPEKDRPEYTDGYRGFYMLEKLEGDVSRARAHYIIRDHDRRRFEARKQQMESIARYMNEEYGQQVAICEITDSYYNMREVIEEHMHLVNSAAHIMELMGYKAKVEPIRGGTDGARLSFEGLPCPNLCTGGHNFHSVYEFISLESMEKVVALLIGLAYRYSNPI